MLRRGHNCLRALSIYMKFIAKDKNISSPVRLGHEGETSNMVCPGRCNPAIGTPLKTQRGYRGVGKVSGQHDPPGRRSNNNMTLDWAYVNESFMDYLLILIQIDIGWPQNQAPTTERMSSRHART